MENFNNCLKQKFCKYKRFGRDGVQNLEHRTFFEFRTGRWLIISISPFTRFRSDTDFIILDSGYGSIKIKRQIQEIFPSKKVPRWLK